MSWLDTPKSEHVIRREHFVSGVETGIQSERERIIALLEAKGSEFADSHDWADVEIITYLVALIKEDVSERRQTQMSEYGDKGENK